jgi:hypothetical protein
MYFASPEVYQWKAEESQEIKSRRLLFELTAHRCAAANPETIEHAALAPMIRRLRVFQFLVFQDRKVTPCDCK